MIDRSIDLSLGIGTSELTFQTTPFELVVQAEPTSSNPSAYQARFLHNLGISLNPAIWTDICSQI